MSKDADFSELSLLNGHPPKLIWLRIGNCTMKHIENLIRANAKAIEEFEQNEEAAILSLI